MDRLTLDRLGDEIAELSAHLDAAAARLLDLIRRFDAAGGWNTGFRSCAEWLSWRTGLDMGAAREKVRVARALATLPHLAQALSRGELSYAKVRALTRVATPDNEHRLLKVGRAGTAAHVERIVRGWRWIDRKAERREAAMHHAQRALRVYRTEDGAVVIRGRLAPEVGTLLLKALDAAREALYQRARPEARRVSAETRPVSDLPSLEQRQADALGLLAETALHRGLDPGTPGERYQVVVHVEARCWPTPTTRVSRSWRTACAFPRKRRSAWPATPAAWSCGTMPRAMLSKSASGRVRFPRRCVGRSTNATRAAVSPAVTSASGKVTTSVTGRTAARPRCPTSRCYADATIAPCTKEATGSSAGRTAS